MWFRKDDFYGWLFRVQSNQDVSGRWKAYIISSTVWCVLLYDYTVWFKECRHNHQRAMSIIFRDHLWKTVECYVDDIVIKSREKNNHLHIWEQCSISCRLTSWRWTRQSLSWEFRVVSSLDSLSHPKEFILILTSSKPFKICSHQRISKNSEVFKVSWLTSVDSS